MLVGAESAGGPAAPGEHAGDIAQGDGFGDPVRDLVGLDVHVVGQVLNGLHGDLRIRVAAPGPDLLDGDQAAGVLHPADPAGAFDGGLVQVHEQRHRPLRLGFPAGVLILSAGVEVEGELAAGELPGR
jgi:hypothetical protein